MPRYLPCESMQLNCGPVLFNFCTKNIGTFFPNFWFITAFPFFSNKV